MNIMLKAEDTLYCASFYYHLYNSTSFIYVKLKNKSTNYFFLEIYCSQGLGPLGSLTREKSKGIMPFEVRTLRVSSGIGVSPIKS